MTLCFNDDISEVLNIVQQPPQPKTQMMTKPSEPMAMAMAMTMKKEEVDSERSGRVLTVFPPQLPLTNLRYTTLKIDYWSLFMFATKEK